MSPLPAWLQTPPPVLGLELDAHGVTAVVVDRGHAPPVIRAAASVALPPGTIVPSLTAANIPDRGAAVSAVRAALEQVGGRHRRVALAIPDTAAKVSLLPFEQVPASARDLDALIRLQLRKTMPFPIDQAQVAWSRGPSLGTGATITVSAVRRDIVDEYDAVCAAAGLHAGTIDLSTFNVVNLVLLADGASAPPAGDWLLVHVTPGYASLVIVRDSEVIFFRTRASEAAGHLADDVHQTRMFYEDRLSGQGFGRVLLADSSETGATPALVRDLETRLDTPVATLDIGGVASVSDRVAARNGHVARVAAPAGLVLREGHL